MKTFINWFEQAMEAIAFAEAGELDTARHIMGAGRAKVSSDLSWAERMAAATALAESGLYDDALMMANGTLDVERHIPLSDFLQDIGLMGAHVRFAVMKVESQVA